MTGLDGDDVASHSDTLDGWFWCSGSPARRGAGSLTCARGARPVLILDRPVVDEPGVRFEVSATGMMITTSGQVEDRVAAWEPIDFHGELENGKAVTVLGAQGGYDRGLAVLFGHRYEARFVLLGARVSPDHRYDGVRFRLANHEGWRGLTPHDCAAIDDRSELSVHRDETDDENTELWLLYTCTAPKTLRELLDSVVGGSQALARLITGSSVPVTDVQVHAVGGDWLQVFSEHTYENPELAGRAKLLGPDVLTIEALATWMRIYDDLDGLPWGVIEPPQGAAQVELLTVASIAEGLHRRLGKRQKRFHLSNGAIARVRRAAREAGIAQFDTEQLADPSLAHQILTEKLAHLEDVTFRDRLDELVARAVAIVPEAIESIPDFVGNTSRARDELAHHLVKLGEPLDVRVLRWATLTMTLDWVLRIFLLDVAGIPADRIRTDLLGVRRFQFHRANVRSHARQIGWLPVLTPEAAGHAAGGPSDRSQD
ncbi:HEPN domain-containing protein [Nocardia sp. CDC160]|uniref:HEPN domain-containing protein n=1 Tax=Nocardia sp. CDC160 TaxID=3112166 RepID=UPI002DBB0DB6|nr:HEPN domain-containing protein [Nocardia sp. CDC160]MEC3915977.1 HEPN domain-containing protein [Nocardia sp. CDC160]